jgi:hypothetical protein
MATTTERSTGIASPVTAAGHGGFAIASGDDYIVQLIRDLAGDVDSDNPFQVEELGLRAVFQNLKDPAWRAQQRRRIEAIFAAHFEPAGLAKFKNARFQDGEEEGNVDMIVTYLSLETQQEIEVTTPIRRR